MASKVIVPREKAAGFEHAEIECFGFTSPRPLISVVDLHDSSLTRVWDLRRVALTGKSRFFEPGEILIDRHQAEPPT